MPFGAKPPREAVISDTTAKPVLLVLPSAFMLLCVRAACNYSRDFSGEVLSGIIVDYQNVKASVGTIDQTTPRTSRLAPQGTPQGPLCVGLPQHSSVRKNFFAEYYCQRLTALLYR